MRIFSCFNRIGFRVGGVESYYIRMYKWAKAKQFKLVFFMQKEETVAKEWVSSFKELDISIVYYEKLGTKLKSQSNIVDYSDTISENSLCITNSFDTFVAANEIFQNCINKINIIFYVVHPHATRLCGVRAINRLCAKPLLDNIKSSNLIFMDEETVNYTSNYYRKINFSAAPIIRLGMEIPNFNIERRKNVYQKENFTILTIARFDFPFKGYISGLIDTYINLKKSFPNLKLIIIGDGEGRAVIEQKLNDVSDDDIITNIHMLGFIPYDEIGEYIEQANVFVGMGTTILDAAKYGVPGIVATAYQMEDYAVGFFASDYTCIGKLIDEDGAKKYRIGELIEEIYKMTESDYLTTCKECHDLVEKHYGIENCMTQIMRIDATKKIKNSFGISLFYNCLLPLWIKLRKTILKVKKEK